MSTKTTTLIHPRMIAEAASSLAQINHQLTDLRHRVAVIEHEATVKILQATNEAGRPTYSNETARTTAQQEILFASEEWRKLYQRIADLEQDRAETIARLEQLRNEFKLLLLDRQEAIANSMAGSLAVLN